MNILAQLFASPWLGAGGVAFCFIAGNLLLGLFKDRLPRDGGRKFAFNGKLTAGRPRGAGIILILVFLAGCLLFVSRQLEYLLYYLMVLCGMLSGYLDDRSETPWNEYKKGAIDLAVCLITALSFLNFNPDMGSIAIGGWSWQMPPVLFVIVATAGLWVSINATNCSDGVDGLCGTLTCVTLTFIGLWGIETGMDSSMLAAILLMIVSILPYLWRNAEPCQMMMGDAGSRAFGLFIGIAILKTGNMLLYFPLCAVLFLDGFLGIVKVSLARFLKIRIMKNIRTPLHDHFRKNKGWSNGQTVMRFAIVQTVISLVLLLLPR
ncbi:MAG TPA: phospho-N-acetylmuramoyl-pentapeptide-transferase [Candidatus Anaerofilum excrementigallinarum]|nr:phospho-N-acetylmuramoyl-pentapeptide-transferase [Candidatus Anaerofilum excrementigallinarum]